MIETVTIKKSKSKTNVTINYLILKVEKVNIFKSLKLFKFHRTTQSRQSFLSRTHLL